MTDTPAIAEGRVARVVGPVVDVEFPPDRIPPLYNALTVDVNLAGQGVTAQVNAVGGGNLKRIRDGQQVSANTGAEQHVNHRQALDLFKPIGHHHGNALISYHTCRGRHGSLLSI